MNMKKTTKTICTLIAAAAFIALLVFLESNKNKYGMAVTVLQKGFILAVVAVSMNLLNGFTGLFSLGQAGFMALGAYTYAIFTILWYSSGDRGNRTSDDCGSDSVRPCGSSLCGSDRFPGAPSEK